MSSAAQEERTTLARPLLTHELGSLAKRCDGPTEVCEHIADGGDKVAGVGRIE